MSFWYGDYTEEEQRGVEKFLVHRFVVGMICVGVMLVLWLTGFSSGCVADACALERYGGTWVLSEHHSDGYDSDDCYVEFRSGEDSFGNSTINAYKNGCLLGEVENSSEIKWEHNTPATNQGFAQKHTINISIEDDRMVFSYTDYVKIDPDEYPYSGVGFIPSGIPGVSPSDILDGFVTSPAMRKPVGVTETYIRISEDTDLTETQRAALY